MRFSIKYSLLALLAMGSAAQASFLVINLPGTSTQGNWAGMTAANYPGYPTFFTTNSPWPNPIAQTSGTGGMSLNKTSGNGFPSNGGGIYSAGNVPGGGSYAISAPTALTSLETIVFQLEIEGLGSNWTSVASGISLNYNGGSQALAPGFSQLISSTPLPPQFGQPANRFYVAYQWDLSSIASISSWQLNYNASEHSIARAIQINQGDTYAAIPEPSTWALLGIAAGTLLAGRRNRRKEHDSCA
ncbi:MAG: PEP-CTERM sorting domain-containing protein [Terrimicrobiaceae bacterium]|nr:PEP-CTERM sorting domain-containing protein [Terrimicrobiaceae bacterium]